MEFKSLEEKCKYYRGLTDYKIMPNTYILAMVDGKNFSRMVKNKFELPFDKVFVNAMNETAKYLCDNVQGCKGAFVQSDEITLLIKDDTRKSLFFNGRLCKAQPLIAAMAATKFTQIMTAHYFEKNVKDVWMSQKNVSSAILKAPIYEFDCKVWSVPDYNEAFAYFLWRQNDCIKNSKQQSAQTYCSYKELLRLTADEQIEFMKNKVGIDWNTAYDDGLKYGRFVVQKEETFTKNITIKGEKQTVTYNRTGWKAIDAFPLSVEENRPMFNEYYE